MPDSRSRSNRALPGTCLHAVTVFAILALSSFRASSAIWYFESEPGVYQAIDDTVKPEEEFKPTYRLHGSINWDVDYRDVETEANTGFDDPVEGAARRATVDSVLSYINSVLNYSSRADIRFELSQLDGTGFIANAGTFFFSNPGFYNGVAFTRITTGSDPLSGNPDIIAIIDFGYPFHAGSGPPPSDRLDLFSAVLRALSHALGLASLSDSSGASRIPSGRVFTRWDDYLRTGTGVDLWSGSGTFNGSASDLISQSVFFTGSQATFASGSTPQVFAPDPFIETFSLSHFDPIVGGGSLNVPYLGFGQMRRSFFPVDLGAMRDIGWSLTGTPFPSPTPRPNSTGDWELFN